MSFKITFKNTWNRLRFYISFLFLAFYLTIAFLFLFSDIWADIIPKGRAIIGLILFLYGSIRFYVSFRTYKNKRAIIKNTKHAKQENASETKQHITADHL